MARPGGKSKAKKYGADYVDDDLIQALTHPLRRGVLRAVNSSRQPIGPQGIEDKLGLTKVRKEHLSSVSYHVRALAERGAISLVDEEQVRGASRHLYVSNVAGVRWVRDLLRKTRKSDEARLRAKGRGGKGGGK
jgi:hypothetical protein